MTGPEILTELERRDYYEQKEREHMELVDCGWFTTKIIIILACLCSIGGNVRELWNALAPCF